MMEFILHKRIIHAPLYATPLTMSTPKKINSNCDEEAFGWVVVVASFVLHGLVLGSLYSFGVYYPVYIEAFDAMKGQVAWIGSIGAALMVAMGLFSGAYADRYSNRLITLLGACFIGIGFLSASLATKLWHLYLSQGLLCGIGYSMTFVAGVAVVGQWFQARRGLAIGIAVAGSGLGQFAVSQWTAFFIAKYGWRSCLRLNGLINAAGLILCSSVLIRKVPLDPNASVLASLVHFKNPNFRWLYAASAIYSIGFFMPFTHLPLYATQHGIPLSQAVLILSVCGASGAIGRIVLGLVADQVGTMYMLQVSVFGAGLTVLCWMGCATFPSLLLIGICYGAFSGGIIAMIPAVCAELFGVQSLSSIVGLLFTANTVGNLISAPLAGILVDTCKTYEAAIAVAGSCLVVASVLYFFISQPNKENETTTYSEVSCVSEGSEKTTPEDIEIQLGHMIERPSLCESTV